GNLNTSCVTCVDPPYVYTQCNPVPYFLISGIDTNFIMKFMITPCASCPDANTLISYNSGANWNSFYNVFGCGGTLIYPNGGDHNTENDSVFYFGYANGQTNYESAIFKSTNRGANWSLTAVIPDLRDNRPALWGNNLDGGFIKVNPFNTNYIFTAHRDYMMLSTDAGYTFNSINIPPLSELEFDYSGNIIYGITPNKIYKSFNNGLSWDNSTVPFEINTMEVSPDNSNVIYAGSVNGLYKSTNRGQDWYLFNNTFYPSKYVTGLSKNPGTGDTIIVSTKDAVYKVFRDQLTNVGSNNLTENLSFKLYQNYPNPFNPTTNIEFGISPALLQGGEVGVVTLKVYDVLGNEVVTLVNERKNPGSYKVEFDGSNFSSGVYYYKLKAGSQSGAGEFEQVRKMMLIK
ncbi:MAG: T9SS type A sorting domain-containing protein, partial [Ignavibacteria bacterium]|nr:T9SS type A sorting domain-containing protein [Ignavibacteria bacterium]